jgi:ribosomal protein S12 methylthiotransferase accessory factor
VPRIRLSPFADVTTTEVGVLLRSDLGTFQLHGDDIRVFLDAMLPLLDGTREKEAIAEALKPYSRQSVMALLDLLEQYGLVEALPGAPEDDRWRGQDAFFRRWPTGSEPLRHLRTARVLMAGLSSWGTAACVELAASGLGEVHLLDDGHVTSDDLLSTRIWSPRHIGRRRAEALQEYLAQAFPWCRVTAEALAVGDDGVPKIGDERWDLLVGAFPGDELRLLYGLALFGDRRDIPSLTGHLDGLDAIVGPVVVPGQTPCWNCSRLRLLANSDHPEAFHALHASLLSQRPKPRPATYLAPMAPLLGHLLALEAVKVLSNYAPSQLMGRLLVQNLVTLRTTVHTVVRVPWCDVCGGPPPRGGPHSDRGNEQEEAANGLRLDLVGEPRDLRALLAGWVDPRTGIIRRLTVEVPEPTEPEMPIVSTAVLAAYPEKAVTGEKPAIGSGKGGTAVEAMVGAVGEALERYSASRCRVQDLHRSALDDLDGDVLNPQDLCLYSDVQYEQPHFPFARFDPARPIDWVRGYWLDTGSPVWIPALTAYFDFRVERKECFCQATSNGLAAGGGYQDAVLRALVELAERDTFMLTWLAARPGHRLLPDEAIEPAVREVLRQMHEYGVEVELFRLESDLPIPTVLSLGYGDGIRWPAATAALGAHLDLRTAVRKAILEQGHVGPYLARLLRARKHAVPANVQEVRTLLDHAFYYASSDRAGAFDFLRDGGMPAIPMREVPEAAPPSLAACVQQMLAINVRVAIADVTSPDIAGSPFRVVRALAAGMQPIDFGFDLRRQPCPRLARMLRDRIPNPNPHPFA